MTAKADLSALNLARIDFGTPLPAKVSTETLDLLLNRRSAPAPTLGLPAPSEDEIEVLIKVGFRVPDHGKIGPWRIVRFTPESKAALVGKLRALAEARGDKAQAGALLKLSTPPEALLVIYSPVQPHKIPLWEQIGSAMAVCQNLLIAAGAMGYGTNWITDWYSYDAAAKAILGLKDGEEVAGFIFLGTPTEAPLERDRPDFAERVSFWEG
ncbi:nitroreductase [Asticcacaulis sp. BYS171W]|uniref:Putative NAD(P)H nitroreductase n=1 Tax=Asticcacaulis aquaticus TaxID=2984212 RepID=A0ABT5HSR6_9CAUL|nr:nitroreductase [Asticcacaulis aquaticus]MDC7682506.1 nitroreductase [Asticcacaulis aquaticus]